MVHFLWLPVYFVWKMNIKYQRKDQIQTSYMTNSAVITSIGAASPSASRSCDTQKVIWGFGAQRRHANSCQTQTLLFGPKPPFYLARAGSRVLFSQPFHLFHRSFSQLSPRSNPQPLMPMSSFLPFSPCNDRILLLTQAAKRLKTRGPRHGLHLGIWPFELEVRLVFFRRSPWLVKRTELLWFTLLTQICRG